MDQDCPHALVVIVIVIVEWRAMGDSHPVDSSTEQAAPWNSSAVIVTADKNRIVVIGDGSSKWRTRDEDAVKVELHRPTVPRTYNVVPHIGRWFRATRLG
jgi:hypothetical protein